MAIQHSSLRDTYIGTECCLHELRSASQLDVESHDFLQKPYENVGGRCIVKGSRHSDFTESTLGGPQTKYEAVFDSRSEFDGLRRSFLDYVGGAQLSAITSALTASQLQMHQTTCM